MKLTDVILEDLKSNRVAPKNMNWFGYLTLLYIVKGFLVNWGFRAVLGYRLANLAYRNNQEIVAKILYRLNYGMTKAQISYRASIGPGLELPHPFGIIIGWDTVVGANCFIGQYVTIGGNLGKQSPEGQKYPRIGDRVMILAGSVVAGPVELGEHVLVGANCVVTQSVPAHYLVKQKSEIIQNNNVS